MNKAHLARRALWLLPVLLLPALWFNAGKIRQMLAGETATPLTLPCADLRAGCHFRINAADYRASIDGELRPGSLFLLQLEGKASQVVASWQMTGMDMGPNRYQLQQTAPGHWQTRSALPVCEQQRQDWELLLTVDGKTVRLQTRAAPR